MAIPKTIKTISPDDQELLEAAGWSDLRLLARADAKAVRAELAKANGILHLVTKVPTLNVVKGWISEARKLTGAAPLKSSTSKHSKHSEESAGDDSEKSEESGDELPSGPVNYEADPDVQEMLHRAPLAIPIPNRQLAEKGIKPSEIEIAPVLNRAESDLELRATATTRKKTSTPVGMPRNVSSGVVQVADYHQGSKRGIDTSRVRSIEEAMEDEPVKPVRAEPRDEDDRLTLLRTARESTNRGRQPGSKFYIRGVLHDRPFKVWVGCFIVVLFQFMVPLAVGAAPLLILSQQMPEVFGWVPKWVIAFPLALPVFGILYFMLSFGVKCRVCGQKVLVPRHCRKNKKAHHVWGLGYILPLALHTLVFKWFNCTFCGTSVRIKE